MQKPQRYSLISLTFLNLNLRYYQYMGVNPRPKFDIQHRLDGRNQG